MVVARHALFVVRASLPHARARVARDRRWQFRSEGGAHRGQHPRRRRVPAAAPQSPRRHPSPERRRGNDDRELLDPMLRDGRRTKALVRPIRPSPDTRMPERLRPTCPEAPPDPIHLPSTENGAAAALPPSATSTSRPALAASPPIAAPPSCSAPVAPGPVCATREHGDPPTALTRGHHQCRTTGLKVTTCACPATPDYIAEVVYRSC